MKKNKTTKSTKKSYSSVKEILKDNNSKIKLTPFNCKEAKFGNLITMHDILSLTGKFDVIFRRASTSERFFGNIENQIPNQILWNEEEQQAYFLNPDKQLYKILFEPVYMKNENNTFTVAASSLDYSNLTVSSDSCVIGNHEIPLEKVNVAIDRFEEETNVRKKDIEDLKFFTEISKEAICQSFDSNIDLIKKEIKEIRNQLFICMSIFGSLTLFLLFGFIYCMMF